jgi:hypothetical protein
MSTPAKYRASHPSTPDSESTVRERVSPASQPAAAPVPSAAPSMSSGSSHDRLEAKLRAARTVLAGLSASDDRARLLHVAIMRRDEALLEGVLAALGAPTVPSVPPPSR